MIQKSSDNSQIPAIIELHRVDSTNNYAHKLVYEGLAAHGTAIFTHDQFAGKGQRGKIWETAISQNILMSTILDMRLFTLNNQFIISAIAAVAARSFFEKYARSGVTIKWPNDIYFQDRKAGGILIENIIRGNSWNWAIIGTGININQTQFANGLQNPVSLKQITGNGYDCLVMADELRSAILHTFAKTVTGELDIIKQYNHYLYKKDQWIRLKKGNAILEGNVVGVTNDGRLAIKKDIEELFDFGDVEWLL